MIELALRQQTEIYFWDGVHVASCDLSTYYDLKFRVDNRWIVIPKEAYIQPYRSRGRAWNNYCVVLLSIHEYNAFILGAPFFASYNITLGNTDMVVDNGQLVE